MIFYNDEIHQVYFRGRHHVAAYLGSVLVWRENVRPMQGVEYQMAAAELGAAAVPASELGTAAALPSPRVRHAEMVPAAGSVMRVQEAQQLNASYGMEALPASLLEMRLPLVLDVQGQMAAAELGAAAVPASELGTAAALPSPRVRHAEMVPAAGNVMRVQEAQQLNASCGMEALPASLPEMRLPPVLADMNAVLASAVLSGGAEAAGALPAVLPGKMKAALTGGGSVVGASALPAALGVKLTASCGLELRWDGTEQEGNLLDVEQVYSAILNGGLLEVE